MDIAEKWQFETNRADISIAAGHSEGFEDVMATDCEYFKGDFHSGLDTGKWSDFDLSAGV
jgi:hypothetical protein